MAWVKHDTQCMAVRETTAVSGSVTLTRVADGDMAGHAELVTQEGDTLSVRFDGAPRCAALQTFCWVSVGASRRSTAHGPAALGTGSTRAPG